MFAIATLFSLVLGIVTVAQAPPQPPTEPVAPPAAAAVLPLENGPCLDSPRPVPRALQEPVSRAMQIVRIDKLESTATMTPGEVIGFLYTLEDGSTWLGQRTSDYMSPSDASAINQVLASTHLPGQNVSQFPPQTRYGVATKYQQFFSVRIPPTAFEALRIQIAPCVAWPQGRSLPDPSM